MLAEFINKLSKWDAICLAIAALLNNLPLFLFYAAACYHQQLRESPHD